MSSIYVCLFEGGLIKVGRSINSDVRIATHEKNTDETMLTFASYECQECEKSAEAVLIEYCKGICTERIAHEWFKGVDFTSACICAAQVARNGVQPTKWKGYVRKILETGITQSDVSQIVGCSQPTLSDLLHGKTKDPSWSLGYGLIRLGRSRGINDPEDILVSGI